MALPDAATRSEQKWTDFDEIKEWNAQAGRVVGYVAALIVILGLTDFRGLFDRCSTLIVESARNSDFVSFWTFLLICAFGAIVWILIALSGLHGLSALAETLPDTGTAATVVARKKRARTQASFTLLQAAIAVLVLFEAAGYVALQTRQEGIRDIGSYLGVLAFLALLFLVFVSVLYGTDTVDAVYLRLTRRVAQRLRGPVAVADGSAGPHSNVAG